MHSPAMLGDYLGIPCSKRGKDKWDWTVVNMGYIQQGFPQDKIIAGCSVFIASHIAIAGLIFSEF